MHGSVDNRAYSRGRLLGASINDREHAKIYNFVPSIGTIHRRKRRTGKLRTRKGVRKITIRSHDNVKGKEENETTRRKKKRFGREAKPFVKRSYNLRGQVRRYFNKIIRYVLYFKMNFQAKWTIFLLVNPIVVLIFRHDGHILKYLRYAKFFSRSLNQNFNV